MATIRKRRSKWQVQIRRSGYPSLSRSFLSKQDAQRWGREQERLVDLGEAPCANRISASALLSELIGRYLAEVSIRKRSKSDEFHFRQIMRHRLGRLMVSKLTSADIAAYRDHRLKSVAGPTVRKELNLLGHLLKTAKCEWGASVKPDLVLMVRKPKNANGRDRRPSSEEFLRIHLEIQKSRNPLVADVALFAMATGMRRGEVLSLEWENVDLTNQTARLPLTKNGESRVVPLGPRAKMVLARQMEMHPCHSEASKGKLSGLIFNISANAVRLAWVRATHRAGITDLRFHDLRHEAISTFFEMGLSVPEVALISGHKDARMLFRYTHLKAVLIAEKLSSAEALNNKNSIM
jgi:integrase